MTDILNFVLHINTQLAHLVSTLGPWVYVLLFAIIFAETGLVVTPFLPGDSLLFAAGAVAGISVLNVHWLAILLMLAAILGNTTNYLLGYWIGPKIFHWPKSRWFNPSYLVKAHNFYEKYGGRAIVIARFLPIIRTFTPFVAGIAKMPFARFQLFSCIGSITWIGSILYLGYWFGNSPAVQENFSYVVIGIVVLSLLPPVFELVKKRLQK